MDDRKAINGFLVAVRREARRMRRSVMAATAEVGLTAPDAALYATRAKAIVNQPRMTRDDAVKAAAFLVLAAMAVGGDDASA